MQIKADKNFKYLNSKNFFQDKKAKSLTFFCKEKMNSAFLDNNLLLVMETISKKYDTDLRLNIHSSPNDKHHDMIILQRKIYDCPVHKHLSNGETIHIIKGSLAIILLDKKKKITNKIILNSKGKLIYRIPTKLYHTVKILSPYAIYHENKNGPFKRKQTILG